MTGLAYVSLLLQKSGCLLLADSCQFGTHVRPLSAIDRVSWPATTLWSRIRMSTSASAIPRGTAEILLVGSRVDQVPRDKPQAMQTQHGLKLRLTNGGAQ